MAEGHILQVFDEEALVGRDANVEAWRRYFAAFPEYMIYPQEFAAEGDLVAVRGRTTGSHLDLADEEELVLSLIGLATVVDG